MRTRLAATQIACSWNVEENLAVAERVVRAAAHQGANIILLQEMFATHFFAFMDWKPEYFKFAMPVQNNPILQRMSTLAKELGVVLPVNFFERANNAYYNTIMMIDDEGRELGIYRKSHIPMGPPGCFEKVYTSDGDTGFKAGRPGLETSASASVGISGSRSAELAAALDHLLQRRDHRFAAVETEPLGAGVLGPMHVCHGC
jgi:predicted amidohydrolase